MALREIVLDTETTGLDAYSGDKIIEIGCVELINRIPTGRVFHEYINPKREVPYYSTKIHGITTEMLQDKPEFFLIADSLIEFIGDDMLIIHNADFDVKFINMELMNVMEIKKKKFELIQSSRVIDTLALARKKFPGASASLDALCKRFYVSLEERTTHGALLDAKLLSKVYVELMGGLQIPLGLDAQSLTISNNQSTNVVNKKQSRIKRRYNLTEREITEHEEFLKKINNPLWKKYNYSET